MPIELPIETLLLALVVLALVIWVIQLEVRFHRLTRGANGKSLERIIGEVRNGQTELFEFRSEVEAYLKNVEKRLGRSVQGVEAVRFDAFRGIGDGGKQSFATAFLDEKGDGLVISSLYRRDHIGVFAKPLQKYTSSFDLTPEEKEAVEKARHSLAS